MLAYFNYVQLNIIDFVFIFYLAYFFYSLEASKLSLPNGVANLQLN